MKAIAITVAILTLVMLTSCYATLIAPPQQITLSGGSENNGAWTGGYWVFTAVVDQADAMEGKVVLPANTTQGFDNGTQIETRKNLEIQVTPEMAYYKRTLKLMDINDRIVAPAVYRGSLGWLGDCGYDKSKSINPTVVNTYTWAESSWAEYTIFNVTVLLDGVNVGQASFNTEQGTKNLVVPTTNGNVLIKDLGRLEGDYTEPQVPNDVVIFDSSYIYSGDALKYIRYDNGRTMHYWITDKSDLMYIEDSEAFSTYWWGVSRWNPNAGIDDAVKESPAPFYKPSATGYSIVNEGKGWKTDDYFGGAGRDPIAPSIFPENGSDSLIDYLNLKTSAGNIAKTWISGYDWSLEYSNGQPSAIVVQVPWGAYSGSPMVTFYVPSELVDTFVYHPPIANVNIVSKYWVNGSDITDNATCRLTLQQESNVTSSTEIRATTTIGAEVFPTSQIVTMEPNATLSVDFMVTNLGVIKDTPGTISFAVLRSWDAQKTDNTSLSFTLKKPVMPLNTTDMIDRPSGVTGNKPLADSSTPWLLITEIACATAVLLGTMTMLYKSKSIKKKDVQSTLTTFGSLGKAGAKEGLKMSKTLWKSSATIRSIAGVAIGVSMLWLGAQPIPALLGTIGFGFLTVSLLSASLVGLGLFVIAVCVVRIFR